MSRFFEMYLFEDRFAFRRLSPPIRTIESTRKIKNRRVSRNECISAACALFTATRCRAGSELWRKDCSITTATSEVYTRVYVCVFMCNISPLRIGRRKLRERGELPGNNSVCEISRMYFDLSRTSERFQRACTDTNTGEYNGWCVRSSFLSFVLLSLYSLSLSLILSPPC